MSPEVVTAVSKKMIRSVIALTLGVAALTASVPAQQGAQVSPGLFADLKWRNIGPHRASRTRAAAGHASHPYTFYMAAVNGGVWKTTDAGRVWKPIFDDQPTGSIGTIAIAPSDANVIYVGSGEGLHRPDLSTGDGIYKSIDAGRTWVHLGLRDAQQIPSIAVDPEESQPALRGRAGTSLRSERGARHLSLDRWRTDVSEGALEGREHRWQRRRHRSIQSRHGLRHHVGRAAGALGKFGLGRHQRRHLQVGRRRRDVETVDQRASGRRPGERGHLSGKSQAALRDGCRLREARHGQRPWRGGNLPQ